MTKLSIVIPAKNESGGLAQLLPELRRTYGDVEIIVVDDGSTDDTAALASSLGVKVVSHPYSKGNGAAIKTGARTASGEIVLFMDGDGQHRAADIAPMLDKMDQGYDMVVGARQGAAGQASLARWGANGFYNWLASWMVGQPIADLTSGMRAARRGKFLKFLHLLPNGFSYPTTSTMAFFRAGYSVGFVPIEVASRVGTSHVKLLRDGVRFLLIIFKIGTLYSPLKLFFPIAMLLFSTGIGYYIFTYVSFGKFTNMSLLLFVASIVVFLIGLISEQICNLSYQSDE